MASTVAISKNLDRAVVFQSLCAVGLAFTIAAITGVVVLLMHAARCDPGDRGALWFWEEETLRRGLEAQFFGNVLTALQSTLETYQNRSDTHTRAGSVTSHQLQATARDRIQLFGSYLPMASLPDVTVQDDTGRCSVRLADAPLTVSLSMHDDPTFVNYQRGTCSDSGLTLTAETVEAWSTGTSAHVVYFEGDAVFTVFARLTDSDLPSSIRLIVLFVDPFDVQTHPAQYPSPGRSSRVDQVVVLVSSDLKNRFVGAGKQMSATIGPFTGSTSTKETVVAKTLCMCPKDPITGQCVNTPTTVLAARSDSLASVGDQIPDIAMLVQMADTASHISQAAYLGTVLCLYEYGSIWHHVRSGHFPAMRDFISIVQTGARNGVPVIMTSRGFYNEQAVPLPPATTRTASGYNTVPFPLASHSLWTVTSYKADAPVNTTEALRSFAIPSLRSHSFDPLSELDVPSTYGINAMIAALEALEWLVAASSLSTQGLTVVTDDAV